METLPPNWVAGELVPEDKYYSDPPQDTDRSRVTFHGLRDDDLGPRYYSIPAETPVDMTQDAIP